MGFLILEAVGWDSSFFNWPQLQFSCLIVWCFVKYSLGIRWTNSLYFKLQSGISFFKEDDCFHHSGFATPGEYSLYLSTAPSVLHNILALFLYFSLGKFIVWTSFLVQTFIIFINNLKQKTQKYIRIRVQIYEIQIYGYKTTISNYIHDIL